MIRYQKYLHFFCLKKESVQYLTRKQTLQARLQVEVGCIMLRKTKSSSSSSSSSSAVWLKPLNVSSVLCNREARWENVWKKNQEIKASLKKKKKKKKTTPEAGEVWTRRRRNQTKRKQGVLNRTHFKAEQVFTTENKKHLRPHHPHWPGLLEYTQTSRRKNCYRCLFLRHLTQIKNKMFLILHTQLKTAH